MPAVTVWPDALTTLGASFGGGINLQSLVDAILYNGIVAINFGTISTANIVGTTAGQFGHANGFIIVPAPGANKAIYPILVYAVYKFGVAAFTGGGNTSVNYGGGGAALTGVVAAASFAATGADKPVAFSPLSTAGVALSVNTSLNLVTTAAFTQPGTATGVINYLALYSTVATSL